MHCTTVWLIGQCARHMQSNRLAVGQCNTVKREEKKTNTKLRDWREQQLIQHMDGIFSRIPNYCFIHIEVSYTYATHSKFPIKTRHRWKKKKEIFNWWCLWCGLSKVHWHSLYYYYTGICRTSIAYRNSPCAQTKRRIGYNIERNTKKKKKILL